MSTAMRKAFPTSAPVFKEGQTLEHLRQKQDPSRNEINIQHWNDTALRTHDKEAPTAVATRSECERSMPLRR